MEECVDKYCKYQPVYSESTSKILQMEFPALQGNDWDILLDNRSNHLRILTTSKRVFNTGVTARQA